MFAQVPDPIIMVAKHQGDVRIHTFVSPFVSNNIANATHIVESKKALVLVDAQFLAPYAKRFRAYADSLGKPIDRLYLSHRHPDHWFGLATAFSDTPVYALPETAAFIKEHGEESIGDHSKLGNLAPGGVVVPQELAEPGEDHVDGVNYVIDRVTETEIDYHLTLGIPQLSVYFAQDLVYSGTHLYVTKHIDHWVQVLSELLLSGYTLFMPGHGLPADKNEIARNIEYLCAAKQAIADGLTNDDFKEFMLRRYPERKCPGIFDIYLPRLFDDVRDF